MILDRARETVESREAHYGHPVDNLDRIAKMWSAYLNKDISWRDVTNLMILLKVSRDVFTAKEDNYVDVVGYIHAWELARDKTMEELNG